MVNTNGFNHPEVSGQAAYHRRKKSKLCITRII